MECYSLDSCSSEYRPVAGSCEHGSEPFCCLKLGNSCVDERLLTSQESLGSMELISYIMMLLKYYSTYVYIADSSDTQVTHKDEEFFTWIQSYQGENIKRVGHCRFSPLDHRPTSVGLLPFSIHSVPKARKWRTLGASSPRHYYLWPSWIHTKNPLNIL
jgi:hypothetical protein